MNIGELKNSLRVADIKEYYKEADGVKLPIHVFYPDNHNVEDKKPAVVCIHGGSWRGITDNSDWDGGTMLPQAKYYAARGTVGVAISYRNFVQPNETRESGKQYPKIYDIYNDCKDAILYLRKNADRFGIDTEKIAVIGDSAGGHLAACLGTLGNKDDRLVNSVIACNPITDLTDAAWIKYIECETEINVIEKAKEISPLYNIEHNSVPMLVMHGTDDDCVIPKHSIDFYEKMVDMGNRCDIKLFNGAKHAFIILNYTATDEQIEAAMEEADRFLISINYLKER